jgi:glycosyltransferase involved in cell wall biosynthesis
VGRPERYKGLDTLLAAWADLMRRGSRSRLLIVGPGDVAAWVREAQRQGVEGG